MKNLITRFVSWLLSFWKANPTKDFAHRLRLIEKRLDWQSSLFLNRKMRRKLHRMIHNERSPFHFTNPRSPIYAGEK